jgi:cobalt-precorrin 5A hydrolase/precorrin-3B C17-methyltransferase
VVVVSSGDPACSPWPLRCSKRCTSPRPGLAPRRPEILPGVSASLATAAQAGAPLGHDFCVMSLSDNLKPWSIIEKRLDLAAQADLALAFYNPISARGRGSWGALEVVRRHRDGNTGGAGP